MGEHAKPVKGEVELADCLALVRKIDAEAAANDAEAKEAAGEEVEKKEGVDDKPVLASQKKKKMKSQHPRTNYLAE